MARHGGVGPGYDAGSKAYDAQLVRRLWDFIRPHQRLIWAALALLLLYQGCRLAMPAIVGRAIDDVGQGDLQALWLWGSLLVAAGLTELFARMRQIWKVDQAGQNALFDLRMAVFGKLQRLSSSFYDKTPIGRLVGRVTTDVEALQEMFSSGVVTILGDFVFLAATVAILLIYDWQLALATFLVVPVLLATTVYIRRRVRRAYQELRRRLSQLNAFLHEHVTGMHLVQMFNREEATRERHDEINAGVRDSQLTTVRWETLLSSVTEMLGSFTVALILWYGGGLAHRDPQALTLGTLFAFIEYMQRFFGPLNDLSQKYTVMQNAMTASDRIFSLLDERRETPEPERPVQAPPAQGEIVFRSVDFAYEPGEPVLKAVDFRVAPGERVAIVGATGSGKTTLLKLLIRLYDVQDGEILLDGVDVRAYALRDLRQRVGIVPQDVFLFAGDLLENVRLGHPEISDEEAIRAAEHLGLGEIVSRFPGGYREPVRERGKNLSSGERQLIAFARVMATAPPILALDEATSNVDSHTEHLLQSAVHELMTGRTSLIIAHRLSTIRDVDRILVLHHGELVEQGTHDELLALRGVYWRLYQLQYEPQEAIA